MLSSATSFAFHFTDDFFFRCLEESFTTTFSVSNASIAFAWSLYMQDTQCGFKLFTRQAARLLFPYLHISRWAFDVELLLLSRLQKVPIVEVPVEWEEKEGSKLNILDASFQMARDLLILKLMYATGIWGGIGLRRLS